MAKFFLLILILLSCNGCIKTFHTSGYIFEEDELVDTNILLSDIKNKNKVNTVYQLLTIAGFALYIKNK